MVLYFHPEWPSEFRMVHSPVSRCARVLLFPDCNNESFSLCLDCHRQQQHSHSVFSAIKGRWSGNDLGFPLAITYDFSKLYEKLHEIFVCGQWGGGEGRSPIRSISSNPIHWIMVILIRVIHTSLSLVWGNLNMAHSVLIWMSSVSPLRFHVVDSDKEYFKQPSTE